MRIQALSPGNSLTLPGRIANNRQVPLKKILERNSRELYNIQFVTGDTTGQLPLQKTGRNA